MPHLLQEIRNGLPSRDLEATGLEEGQHLVTGAMVHNKACRQSAALSTRATWAATRPCRCRQAVPASSRLQGPVHMGPATSLEDSSDMKECNKVEGHTLQKLAHLYNACHVWHRVCTTAFKLSAGGPRHWQLTLRQQQDVIKEVIALGCWLEQRHEQGCLPVVHKVAHALDNLEGAAAVQASGDLQAGQEACHRGQ